MLQKERKTNKKTQQECLFLKNVNNMKDTLEQVFGFVKHIIFCDRDM